MLKKPALFLLLLCCVALVATGEPADEAAPAVAGDVMTELPVVFTSGPIALASPCTVTINCSLTNISCYSAAGNCSTSGGDDCVVCDGVVKACCSCADCEAQCDINYANCEAGCGDLGPFCYARCDRIYDRCLGNCPC